AYGGDALLGDDFGRLDGVAEAGKVIAPEAVLHLGHDAASVVVRVVAGESEDRPRQVLECPRPGDEAGSVGAAALAEVRDAEDDAAGTVGDLGQRVQGRTNLTLAVRVDTLPDDAHQRVDDHQDNVVLADLAL